MSDNIRLSFDEVRTAIVKHFVPSLGYRTITAEQFDRWLYEQKADAFDQGASEMKEHYYSGEDVINPYRQKETK